MLLISNGDVAANSPGRQVDVLSLHTYRTIEISWVISEGKYALFFFAPCSSSSSILFDTFLLSSFSAMSSSVIPRGQVDLVDFVDWSGVECLNQIGKNPIANALKQGYRDDDGLHLESDADEQLLIYIPFTQVVKLHSAVITGPEEEGPRTVKLFANKEHMGFSNVNDPPSDSFNISADNLKGKPVTLKYVKFQNVCSLTIFIEDNQGGGDVTKLQKISLYGTTVDTTNMKDLKKIEDH
ncbi:PITH domain-containing protein At3g04780-like [Zingiber officinale]|uniref:PITH domain-containing protein At3g04780-like n=1 Tax=Zingiber officinale TaxID=94328 RepID=UPI001C4C0894|nr:PITH domain-containing protein At3g04780-like [Zingiber officinale]